MSSDWLSGFSGIWRVRRRIVDRLYGHMTTVEGQASIEADRFEERGEMRAGGTSLLTHRSYGLAPAADHVVVRFADGREFIRLSGDPAQAVTHHCGDDLYRGRLIFPTRDSWVEIWHVTGPRKRYASIAHYDRA